MSKTTYRGINYAGPRSNVNRDVAADIRYGIIPQRVLHEWTYSEFEFVYPEPDEEADEESDWDSWGMDLEPIAQTFTQDGYEVTGDLGSYATSDDLTFLKSPYFTYAQYCSPCAPGACYITAQLDTDAHYPDNRCYCPGPDWFEAGQCPIDIWEVKTGRLVKNVEVQDGSQ